MDGTLHRTDTGYEVRFERTLAHPIEAVWAALVDPVKRATWFFAGTLEPEVGGTVDLEDSAHGITGTVTAVESLRLLEFTWSSYDAPVSTVRFELSEDVNPGCTLRFTHFVGVDARPEKLLPGWHCVFDDLARHLGGEPLADLPGRFAAVKQRYAAVSRQ